MHLSQIAQNDRLLPQGRACLHLFGHAAGGLDRVPLASFEDMFPEQFEEVEPSFKSSIPSPRVYKLARREVLRIFAHLGYRDSPWESLRMLIREAGRKDTLEHAWGGLKTPAIEAGLMPADITAEWVWSLEAEAAGGNRRQSLRKGAAVFDELFEIPTIADSGLLPPKRIGSGPVYNRSGKVKASLPSQMAQISKNASSSQKSAISAVWRAIVASDLTFSDDPSPVEILAVQGQIAELPASLAGVSESSWSLYQGRFRAALRKAAEAHAVG